MSSEVLASTERKMARAIEVLERDFVGVRTGRASPSVGPIVAIPQGNGQHHRYERRAASSTDLRPVSFAAQPP